MTATTRLDTTDAAPPALYLTRNYDWRDDASCRETDPEIFFPVGSSAFSRQQETAAKRVCAGCPVRVECLTWALESGQYTGVWGGLSEDERRGLHADSQTAFLRCLEQQAWVEEQRAAEVPVREIARSLRVSYEVLRRVLRYLEKEQAAGSVRDTEEVAAA
jgi:WhiB family redox-sensing transcriptional regulator